MVLCSYENPDIKFGMKSKLVSTDDLICEQNKLSYNIKLIPIVVQTGLANIHICVFPSKGLNFQFELQAPCPKYMKSTLQSKIY